MTKFQRLTKKENRRRNSKDKEITGVFINLKKCNILGKTKAFKNITMKYELVHAYIPIRFPELSSKYHDEIKESIDGENVLNYVLFPAIFHYYVNDLLKENVDTSMLNRIFEFYEEMAIDGDDKVKTLLQVGLLECLWDEKSVYENSKQYMKAETRNLFENVGLYLRIPKD